MILKNAFFLCIKIIERRILASTNKYLLLHVQLLVSEESSSLKEVVMKEYYPIQSLDKIESDSLAVKEAQAYLKKRAEMYSQSIDIFLSLIDEVTRENLESEIYLIKTKSQNSLSFSKIFQEIIEILNKSMERPDFSDGAWINCIRKLFKIKNKFCNQKDEQKQKLLKKYIFSKISELLNLISKSVEFEKVLKELINIEKDADFSYTNEWFKSIFYSKNDQEFLYISATALLSNENSQMIETILHQSESGIKGDVYAGCAICGERIGAKYSQSSCIFFMCGHNFHNKCYSEEIAHSLNTDSKSCNELITECPLCLKTRINLESKQRRKINTRRHQIKNNDKRKNNEEVVDYFSLADDPPKTEEPPAGSLEAMDKEEMKSHIKMLYFHKLGAFDDDYAAVEPIIIFR